MERSDSYQSTGEPTREPNQNHGENECETADLNYVCRTCTRSFDSLHGLKTHIGLLHTDCTDIHNCDHCESVFYTESTRRYCSADCRRASTASWGSNNPNYNGGKTKAECELCGETFRYYQSEKEGRFCPDCVQTRQWQNPPQASGEDNPRWNGGKRRVNCVVCGTTVERYPSNISENTVCSEECRRTWLSDEFSGAGHPNWEGGGNEAYGKGWNRVREQALERDGYQCVYCGATRNDIGRNPDVHHIVPVRRFIDSDERDKEEAHFLENVISLCVSCHRKADFEKISRTELWSFIGVDQPVVDP